MYGRGAGVIYRINKSTVEAGVNMETRYVNQTRPFYLRFKRYKAHNVFRYADEFFRKQICKLTCGYHHTPAIYDARSPADEQFSCGSNFTPGPISSACGVIRGNKILFPQGKSVCRTVYLLFTKLL